MKFKSFFVWLFFVPALCLISCGGNNQSQQYSQEYTTEEESQTGMTEESKSDDTTWQYSKTEDDLTHNVTSFNAIITSTNEIPFDRYGNTARLVIYLSYKVVMGKLSTSVMFCFVDDDNMCRFSKFKGSGILAVFDNGEVDDRWSWIDMVDSRKSIYTYNSAKVLPFVEQLKASKKARIQVNLEHVGMKTFDFNVEGLQWDFEN